MAAVARGSFGNKKQLFRTEARYVQVGFKEVPKLKGIFWNKDFQNFWYLDLDLDLDLEI